MWKIQQYQTAADTIYCIDTAWYLDVAVIFQGLCLLCRKLVQASGRAGKGKEGIKRGGYFSVAPAIRACAYHSERCFWFSQREAFRPSVAHAIVIVIVIVVVIVVVIAIVIIVTTITVIASRVFFLIVVCCCCCCL